MELTARVEYGVLALVEMALASDGKPLHAADIARAQSIPRAYLDQLLLSLRRQGIVQSLRGPGGGHRLALAADRISLRDVLAALEGEPGEGTGRRQREPSPARESCGLLAAWRSAQERFLGALGATTIDDLAQTTRRNREASMYHI